eukprot:6898044-Pyramimonas_sp.AAC.1
MDVKGCNVDAKGYMVDVIRAIVWMLRATWWVLRAILWMLRATFDTWQAGGEHGAGDDGAAGGPGGGAQGLLTGGVGGVLGLQRLPIGARAAPPLHRRAPRPPPAPQEGNRDLSRGRAYRCEVLQLKPRSRRPKRPSTSTQQSTVDVRLSTLVYHSAHGVSNIP